MKIIIFISIVWKLDIRDGTGTLMKLLNIHQTDFDSFHEFNDS